MPTSLDGPKEKRRKVSTLSRIFGILLNMKAILIPFRIKNARGRLAPVKPAQVAQMFAKYEAQVMAELTAQGFTVTDLNSTMSCNVPADILAERDGVQWLVDARGGYRAAERVEIEKKGRTMEAFRNENFPGAKLALAFGNATTMQVKSLKKSGTLAESLAP